MGVGVFKGCCPQRVQLHGQNANQRVNTWPFERLNVAHLTLPRYLSLRVKFKSENIKAETKHDASIYVGNRQRDCS